MKRIRKRKRNEEEGRRRRRENEKEEDRQKKRKNQKQMKDVSKGTDLQLWWRPTGVPKHCSSHRCCQ